MLPHRSSLLEHIGHERWTPHVQHVHQKLNLYARCVRAVKNVEILNNKCA